MNKNLKIILLAMYELGPDKDHALDAVVKKAREMGLQSLRPHAATSGLVSRELAYYLREEPNLTAIGVRLTAKGKIVAANLKDAPQLEVPKLSSTHVLLSNILTQLESYDQMPLTKVSLAAKIYQIMHPVATKNKPVTVIEALYQEWKKDPRQDGSGTWWSEIEAIIHLVEGETKRRLLQTAILGQPLD